MSPYLLLNCVAGLLAMIRKAELRGDIHKVKVYRQAPFVSHMLIVNDSVLFSRVSVQDSNSLKHILHSYDVASRQKINFDKSTITFSKNTQGKCVFRFRQTSAFRGWTIMTSIWDYLLL